ncbi:hypothetical protein [Aeromonas caviae]|uniref:hypothetical protein n=1 Tax=Aeromonas caviae TaxID=648 RepID=UPI00313BF279
MKRVNSKFIMMTGGVLLASLLAGCESAEDVRRKSCSSAILDMNRATMGDEKIDIKAAEEIIFANKCVYNDVLPEEKKAWDEELIKNPIPRNPLKQDGVDWSKPWHDKKHEW